MGVGAAYLPVGVYDTMLVVFLRSEEMSLFPTNKHIFVSDKELLSYSIYSWERDLTDFTLSNGRFTWYDLSARFIGPTA